MDKYLKYLKYFKQFKTASLILVGTILLFVFACSKIAPSVTELLKIKKECSVTLASLNEKQKLLESLKAEEEKQKEEQEEEIASVRLIKDFYIPMESGLDKEAVIAGEFADVLKIMREYTVRARSVNYDYEPADDAFYTNASDRYNVAEVEMDLVANYNQFKNFLIDIFKHEHLINIVSIEIQPYNKDRKILLIRFTMRLYGKMS